MLNEGPAWFLIADGRRARVLIEAKRGAALEEPSDWNLRIEDQDLYEAQDRAPRSFDRVGAGRHAMDGGRNLHEAEEEHFLKRLAARIGQAAQGGAFDHLVIAAPPRALGLLRQELPDVAKRRIRAEASKDVLEESSADLRRRLQELLRG